MDIKKGQLIEVAITGIAFGGKGIARVDGFTVFVDHTVPGDRVQVAVVRKKKNFADARVANLIEPSPDRVIPECRYSGFCGGCKWQFLKYEKQLEYKQQHVAEAVEHIGLIKDVPVHPVIPSEKTYGYRNKMEFSCSDKRWLLPEELGNDDVERDFAIGLHVSGTFHKVLDTEACLLMPEAGSRILSTVRGYMKQSGFPPYGLKTHTGFWRFLMLRHSAAHDNWLVNLVTATENKAAVQPLADVLMEQYPEIVSVVNNVTASKAGVAIGEFEILLGGNAFLKDRMGCFNFEISANSFFQTNTAGAGNLYNKVKEYAGLSGSQTVLDLYSGTGTIPILLSNSAKEVTGIEIVADAVADAEKNCLKNGITNCRFIKGDIRDALSGIKQKPDVLIIDPPRAGMHKDVVKQVADMAPERIVYVSCNPATMARDFSMIKDAYRVMEIQPVDMFPHTYHIESVARLELK